MPRKQPYIHTTSYVHTKDGGLVRLADLPEEKRKEVGTQLMLKYMNALYKGKAEFFIAEDAK